MSRARRSISVPRSSATGTTTAYVPSASRAALRTGSSLCRGVFFQVEFGHLGTALRVGVRTWDGRPSQGTPRMPVVKHFDGKPDGPVTGSGDRVGEFRRGVDRDEERRMEGCKKPHGPTSYLSHSWRAVSVCFRREIGEQAARQSAATRRELCCKFTGKYVPNRVSCSRSCSHLIPPWRGCPGKTACKQGIGCIVPWR